MTHKLILCDDEIHILKAAEFKLSRAGYSVRCAHDGQEAWELIQAERPDLLVTDCQMPRLDGLALSLRIRQTPELADLPIIMLTAKGFESNHVNQATQHGISVVLPKPFSPRQLQSCVQQVLETGHYELPPALI